jgi:hypothetical protein
MTINSRHIKNLLQLQRNDWDLVKANYGALENVKTKEFVFQGFRIRVQFNPARIQSSAAKVDEHSIKERKCFLCPHNLPPQQQGIPLGAYQALVNPYPIFPEHFTIPAYRHEEQLIAGRFPDMLDMARSFDKYVLFYNGPKCGASAPDHAHFQAGNKGFLPLEQELAKIPKELILSLDDTTSVYAVSRKDYGRNMFVIESNDFNTTVRTFDKLYSSMEVAAGDKEPMMNILCWYERGVWHTAAFPREKHRPACFFAEGEANLLISPAAVDLGGALITPLEKDFDKITISDIENIFREISISDDKARTIAGRLKNE